MSSFTLGCVQCWAAATAGRVTLDCLVKRNFTVPHPEVLSLVSYISMRSSVKFVFSFLDKKFKETRDAVILTNFKIIYNKTRNSITKTSNQDLAKLIPEGWNRIIVTLTGRYLTVTLVQPEGHVLLYTQHFDYDVTEIYGEGDVTRCSEAAPVFYVPEGEEVPVQLWPEGSKQFIKLLPGNSTDLYFKFPGEAKNYSVPSNSTLLISTSFQGDQTMLEVFKVTDIPIFQEGDRKLIGNSTVPINTIMSPIFGGGPAQLRLTKVPECCNSSLAAPVTTPPAVPCCVLSAVFGIVCVILVIVIVALVILRKRELKKRPDKSSSDDIEANDADGNEQMALMNQNNNGITKKFTVLASLNDVSRFVDTLSKHCGVAARIDVYTTAMNDGQEESQQLPCISDNLHNIKNEVMNQIKQLHNIGPALIDFMGTMEQEKWQALLQSLKDYNLQFRELAITS
ncbi:uncharacterized protein LOC123520585 isoform X2 [Portunus trituberculatus]|uniref:uncharacterized protein LOC123520585 isoform X2 n=1 Tax=Portunus trituberculatus TaxID=210409 RepID=UPI001E1D15E1|nr:uncharacterized protein LOC123520585 isoform X2 [Portunus trituberculatus]